MRYLIGAIIVVMICGCSRLIPVNEIIPDDGPSTGAEYTIPDERAVF